MIEKFVICDRCSKRVQLKPDDGPEGAGFLEVSLRLSYSVSAPRGFARNTVEEHWCLACANAHRLIEPEPEPQPAPVTPPPAPDVIPGDAQAKALLSALKEVQKVLP